VSSEKEENYRAQEPASGAKRDLSQADEPALRRFAVPAGIKA